METMAVTTSPKISTTSNLSPTFINSKRKAGHDSISLRKGTTLDCSAEPNKSYTVPPRLRHAPPNPDLKKVDPEVWKSLSSRALTSAESGYNGGDNMQSMDTDGESPNTSFESLQRSNPEDWFQNWNKDAGMFLHGPSHQCVFFADNVLKMVFHTELNDNAVLL